MGKTKCVGIVKNDKTLDGWTRSLWLADVCSSGGQ